ncbi:isocitrate dehydrogenase NAD regulatory subunit 1 [Musa troglodytarum]|uniref:Isocitrate dehydrogenase NAD regulatory subunit 1 n=1 Tax=Musa troglodytarum TaxID=320322 RepID=A0A9E7I3H0_9LILI|nr:isocitrate dehydrogenase NAD regulatory subunit 1 [Musa troglodytarum]
MPSNPFQCRTIQIELPHTKSSSSIASIILIDAINILESSSDLPQLVLHDDGVGLGDRRAAVRLVVERALVRLWEAVHVHASEPLYVVPSPATATAFTVSCGPGRSPGSGSRRLQCARNVGQDHAVFEQGASAGNVGNEKIVEQKAGNPVALLLSSAMMLRHLQFPSFADRHETAVKRVIAEGKYCSGCRFTRGIH